jgi:hypothetical protein
MILAGIGEVIFSAYRRPSLNPARAPAVSAALFGLGAERPVSAQRFLAVFQTDEDGKSPRSLSQAAQISRPGSAAAREGCAPRSPEGGLAAVMAAAVVAGGIAAAAVQAAAATVVAAVDVFSPATAVVGGVRVVAVGVVVARAVEIVAAALVAAAAALVVASAVAPRRSA